MLLSFSIFFAILFLYVRVVNSKNDKSVPLIITSRILFYIRLNQINSKGGFFWDFNNSFLMQTNLYAY